MVRSAWAEADEILRTRFAEFGCQGTSRENETLRRQENDRRIAVLVIDTAVGVRVTIWAV